MAIKHIELIGEEELIAKLKAIDIAGQTVVISSALDAGADTVVEVARDKAPGPRTGTLDKGIVAEGEGPLERKVGFTRDAFYGKPLEFGTGPRKLKKPHRVKIDGKWVTVTHTGSLPARPFLRPALDDPKVQDDAQRAFKAEMRKLGGI